MRILALDTSSQITGWAIVDWNEGYEVPMVAPFYGSFKLKEKGSIGQRLYLFRGSVMMLIDKYSPQVLAIEQSHVKFRQTAIVLAKFVGCAEELSVCTLLQDAVLLTAGSVRRLIESKDKDDTKRVVSEKFHIDLSKHPLDVSDAIALGWAAPSKLRLVSGRKAEKAAKKRKVPMS
jgi:Holliday junction resolvasome RuvABC endonuclease subunit